MELYLNHREGGAKFSPGGGLTRKRRRVRWVLSKKTENIFKTREPCDNREVYSEAGFYASSIKGSPAEKKPIF